MLSLVRSFCVAALVVGLVGAAPARPKVATARHAMVATAQHYATDVGVRVLKAGGNAVDAAVAIGYALAVVDPCCGNLGGGGFMVIHLAHPQKDTPHNVYVDFQVRAPLLPTTIGPSGYHIAAIPGSVSGLEYARTHYGTKSLAYLIAPSIPLAKNGFVLQPGDVTLIRYERRRLAEDPSAARIFLPHGNVPAAGSRLVQSDLAKTLQTLSQRGVAAMYGGSIGDAIVKAANAHGVPFSHRDFASYRTTASAPLKCAYRGLTVLTTGAPSAGGAAICMTLGILDGYNMKALGFRTAAALHDELEAERLSYVDAFTLIGDPSFVRVPLAALVSPAHAAQMRSRIGPTAAPADALNPDTAARPTDTHTTSYSVVDAAGNAVAVTYTLGDYFGSKVVPPGTGILLATTLTNFHRGRGYPDSIAPGKRPLSSMSPTIVLRNGKPYLVVGSAGSVRIITENLAMIRNVIDYGMNIQDAISEPRVHVSPATAVVTYEAGAISPPVVRALEAMGYTLRLLHHAPQDSDGVEVDPITGLLLGGYDPREGVGSAGGY